VLDDAERMARFEREAKVLASLQHTNIVTVHSIENADGVHFLTMELVEGETLSEVVRRGSLPLERLYALASALAGALHAAHRDSRRIVYTYDEDYSDIYELVERP
jgi:serine/threonine protein kinase